MNSELLYKLALTVGFSDVALCDIMPFIKEEKAVAHQPALKERRQLRFDPKADTPQAKSLAVLLWAYPQARFSKGQEVFIDSYYAASNAAYHAARKLEEMLSAMGVWAKANVSYPARAAAVRAGLGIIGKNGLLITSKYGTRVVILLMVTDIEPPVRNESAGECLNCGRCIAACPSAALTANGMEHPERCLRNFMMEGEIVPEDIRSRMRMNLIGCDMCQRVCPMQQRSAYTDTPTFYLSDFVTDDDRKFSASIERLSDLIGRNTARPQRVRAQAALLAGNSRDAQYAPVLRQWAHLPFDAVREHALWSIAQIESAQKSSDRP